MTTVSNMDLESNEILKTNFNGHQEGFCRFGDMGYVLPKNYRYHVDKLNKMQTRCDDIWILGYPRSGTTMTQEMVWLLNNNLNFEFAAKQPLKDRYYFIEFFTMVHEQIKKTENDVYNMFTEIGYKSADLAPTSSPRYIKSHLPLSLLPPCLLDNSKVIYLARDPRDVAVSYYHQNKLFKFQGYNGDFPTYWKLFINDLIPWTPYFAHIKEAWKQRNHPNLLFLFYEDISKDICKSTRKVSDFLGKKYSDSEMERLKEHLDFKNFKNNESVHPAWMKTSKFVNFDAERFIRRGKAGGWRDYFDEKMSNQAKEWLDDNLKDTDLRFPETDC